MRFRAGLAVAALLLAGACGQAEETPEADPKDASPTSEPTEATDLASTVIAPGKVGPFVVGMTAAEASEQEVVREPPAGAPCPALEAAPPLQEIAVRFSSEKPEPLLGVLVKVEGPETAEGIGVGSTLEDAKDAYGAQLKKEEGDYGDTVYRVYDGDSAMGFSASGGTKPTSKIDAIEVFDKRDPVVWDGC